MGLWYSILCAYAAVFSLYLYLYLYRRKKKKRMEEGIEIDELMWWFRTYNEQANVQTRTLPEPDATPLSPSATQLGHTDCLVLIIGSRGA